jgi:hypothetical protein
MTSFGREVKLWVPCPRFMARKNPLRLRWSRIDKTKFDRPFLARSFPSSLIKGSILPERLGLSHERASHSGRYGCPCRWRRKTNTSGAQRVECNKGLSAYGFSRSQANLSIHWLLFSTMLHVWCSWFAEREISVRCHKQHGEVARR